MIHKTQDSNIFQVRVCAFPASRLGFEGIGISPDCNPENRAGPREVNRIDKPCRTSTHIVVYFSLSQLTNRTLACSALVFQLFNWALEPAEDHILDRLFELGYQDAAVWAEDNPVEKLVEEERQD